MSAKASWATAVPDWRELIVDGKPPLPKLKLFDAEAERALRIFKRLRAPDIEGNPTYGEICDEWVFALVRVVFGSYDPDLKRRMIREFFLLIPKKNGKSSIAAAIMVVAIIMNARPEAEALMIAPTKKIADIAFKHASGIIRLDPELKKLFHPQTHIRQITHRLTLACIVIRAADTDVITGGKATFTLIDETHVFAKMSRAKEVFVEIRGALASRPDGFLLQITTQSKEPPSGVFAAELTKARAVRDGEIVLPVLAVLYEFPEPMLKDGAWKRRENWRLVNPNLGRSVDEAFLSDELMNAEREGADSLSLFASQHFNVQIGQALRADRWEGAEHWKDNGDPAIADLQAMMARCDVCVVGIDGGGLDDLLGLAILGRETETRDWLLWSHAWGYRGKLGADGKYHGGLLERRKEIITALQDFEAEGTFAFYEQPGEEIEELVDIVMMVDEAGLLPEKHAIGVDVAGISDVVDELARRGVTIESERIIGISQGWRLTNAIKTMARRLAAGTMLHGASRLMAWCVGNARQEPRGNAVVVTKQTAGSAKIDPLVAAFAAVELLAKNPENGRRVSVYELLAQEAAAGGPAPPAAVLTPYESAREAYARQFLMGDDD